MTGADERVIEASLGLGEAVVAGRVIPDHFRMSREGEILERTPGRKDVAFRSLPDGGTFEEQVPAERVEQLCLTDEQLARAEPPGRPVRGGLRRGSRHRVGDRRRHALPAAVPCGDEGRGMSGAAHSRAAARVPLFADLEEGELEKIASVFKERRFPQGETVIQQGSGAAAFYVIDSGEVDGARRRRRAPDAEGR